MTLNRVEGTAKGEINKVAGPEWGECCGQNAGIVLEAEREAITARAIHWPRAPHRVPHELLHFFCYLTSWFITDRQLSFKRSTTLTPPQMPPEKRERERESESLHSLVKRLEDGQNHIVHGFKKEAYGQYEKKRNVLLKAEKNESAYTHNQLDVRWSSNRKEAAIERDGI